MAIEATLLAAFKAVNERSPEGVMACWSSDGVYDNPMVGNAAKGYDAVKQCMVNLIDGLSARGQLLIVDRVTVGQRHVIAEWHVDPPDGRRGVHVADIDEAGKLLRVTVYPRAGT
ncbi:MAG TPA: nuclear transport factor 2 family protein [Tepidisphaeraceae bacterium]|jgi:hypothetical protein